MRIISNKTLKNFYELNSEYKDSKVPLEVWYLETLKANWKKPQEIKAKFRSASILKNSRVVFNIAGNKYRLIVAIDYNRQVCFIKFVGTHKQYDLIDAEIYNGYSTNKNRTGL
ncbi:MAG: type II toxin-antitoxin system HigB family toxin [Methylococcales bacterium]|nr:type II toxin-antitoxin system HigB family toxin [Methylococcales bacterium]